MAKKTELAKEGFNDILLYTTANGKVKVEIFLQNGIIWLTQQKIADLFVVDNGLNRIVTMYLDYAETQAQKKVPMYMRDWVARLDAFLQFNEHEILKETGKVSHEIALALAEKEFNKYSTVQDR